MFNFWKKSPPPVSLTQARELVPQVLGSRRFMRLAFQAPARLTLGTGRREVQLLDISLKGALVDLGRVLPCAVGVRGRLSLWLSTTVFIAMDVTVRYVQGQCLGLQCEHIDLDSATHLRQIVERNAHDPSLLTRELMVLVGQA